MSQTAVLDLTRDLLWPKLRAERDRLRKVDRWLRRPDEAEQLDLPRGATKEHKSLRELADTPLLGTVVTTMSQGLFVDGYSAPDQREDASGWRTWQANDFETRQSAIHRAAISYGTAYVTVTPGTDADGPRSVMRGVSPRKMLAVYQDPAEDDWPMYAIRSDVSGRSYMLRVYDEEAVYYLSLDPGGSDLEFIEWREHGVGVCPVVRYTNLLDLEGRADGEVEQLIPIAARHRKTVYDRLLTQHYNSWKVRTIAGLQDFAESQDQADQKKLRLRQDDILVAEDADTKFGTLDETPLDGFISAAGADKDDLSSVAQIPSTVFGHSKIANLSADAITELRAGLNQKLFERKASFGKSHAQALRLANRLETGEEGDVAARVQWRDMSPATIAQVVDALGKAVDQLGVPAQGVWHMIPGVSRADIEDWTRTARTAAGREAITALAEAARLARENQAA